MTNEPISIVPNGTIKIKPMTIIRALPFVLALITFIGSIFIVKADVSKSLQQNEILKIQIESVRIELKQDMKDIKDDLKNDIRELRQELRKKQ